MLLTRRKIEIDHRRDAGGVNYTGHARKHILFDAEFVLEDMEPINPEVLALHRQISQRTNLKVSGNWNHNFFVTQDSVRKGGTTETYGPSGAALHANDFVGAGKGMQAIGSHKILVAIW